MKTKLLKNSYVLPMTLFCSALTFSPLGVAQAHATTNVVQQAKTVKGTVVDETGEPVIGASVMVKVLVWAAPQIWMVILRSRI